MGLAGLFDVFFEENAAGVVRQSLVPVGGQVQVENRGMVQALKLSGLDLTLGLHAPQVCVQADLLGGGELVRVDMVDGR